MKQEKEETINELSGKLANLLQTLRLYKPEDRSELDRRFAVALTEAEKLNAYIIQYIIIPLGYK